MGLAPRKVQLRIDRELKKPRDLIPGVRREKGPLDWRPLSTILKAERN